MVFTTCLLISNLVASKIVVIASVAVPVGIFLFPITYIINDVIAEVWGFRKARLMIWLAFAMNFFAVLFYQFAVALPTAPFWSGQDAFSTILSSNSAYCCCKSVSLLGRIVSECLRDEQDEGGYEWE